MQWIKPRQPRPEETAIALFGKKLPQPRAIDVGQNKSRQGEEELHPQIAPRRQEVDPAHPAVMMAFAEMKQHNHQRRQRPRARKCAYFRWSVLPVCHASPSCDTNGFP